MFAAPTRKPKRMQRSVCAFARWFTAWSFAHREVLTMRSVSLAFAAVTALALTAGSASAHPPGYGYPGGYGGGHYDYHPGQLVRHGNHYHYQPGHYHYHPGPAIYPGARMYPGSGVQIRVGFGSGYTPYGYGNPGYRRW